MKEAYKYFLIIENSAKKNIKTFFDLVWIPPICVILIFGIIFLYIVSLRFMTKINIFWNIFELRTLLLMYKSSTANSSV